MFKLFGIILFIYLVSSCALTNPKYPPHWWKPVPKEDLKWWEISPQAAKKGEVVLSKRNELGILSNFSHAPFSLDGVEYPNVEALWQSMKYPENKLDKRYKLAKWPFKRSKVETMDGFSAKDAGDKASVIMEQHKLNYVTYQGKEMTYRTTEKGDHYKLIKRAMLAKLKQNPEVERILLRTKGLVLIPDHHTKETDPPAWKYYKIWMVIRDQLLSERR